jgi:hypothetical protein
MIRITGVAAALLLVFGCCALTGHGFSLQPDSKDNIDPSNPFPAGIPHLDNPFKDNLRDPWTEPELSKNAYRGLYVSAAAAAAGQSHQHKLQ